jgi:hypothetical protein
VLSEKAIVAIAVGVQTSHGRILALVWNPPTGVQSSDGSAELFEQHREEQCRIECTEWRGGLTVVIISPAGRYPAALKTAGVVPPSTDLGEGALRRGSLALLITTLVS